MDGPELEGSKAQRLAYIDEIGQLDSRKKSCSPDHD